MKTDEQESLGVAQTYRRKRFIRLGIGFLAILLIVVVGTSIYSRAPQEPIVEGRPISYWLVRTHEPADKEAAIQAVEKTGTNAIPWLLAQLWTTTPAWKYKLNRLLARQRFISFRFEDMTEKHKIAVAGFEVLGSKARIAIPELAKMRQERPEAYYPLAALNYCGKEAIPFLWMSLTNGQSWIATVQATVLIRGDVVSGRLDVSDAMQFVPALMQLQMASNSPASKRAEQTLKVIQEKAAERSSNRIYRRPN